jgi:hypothetical protein
MTFLALSVVVYDLGIYCFKDAYEIVGITLPLCSSMRHPVLLFAAVVSAAIYSR